MGLRRRGPRSQAKDLSETEKVKKGVLTEIHLLEDFLALCAACIASVAMGNHQGNKNSSLLNNLEFESACQRGNGLSCSASPQSTFHISPRALRTSFKGRKSRRLTIMNTLNVEKRLQSITEQRFDTTELLPRSASDTIKEGNEQYSSQILDFASGFKTSLVLSSRTHSTEGQTSNLTFSETTEYTRNSEMANDLSDYDDELYVGNWSIEDRFESLQGEIDPQCNLAIGLKELALPMKDVMVKESLWDHQSTPLKVRMKVGQLEGIIECNSIIPLDQLRGCLDSPEQTSTASGLIHTDDKLPISEIKDINQEEFLPMEKLQFLGEDMDQSLQRALKAGAHFAHYGEDCEGIRGPQMEQMSLVWTRDPETVNQEPIYIFQMTPVMSTQSKPERKTTSSCSAFIYLLSSSNGLGSTPPLGSCCSSDHSIPMLQHHVLPLHKEERGEGNKTQLIAEKSPGVDGSSFSGSVSFLDSLNNNQTSQTFTTMLVSITAGEDMSLLDQNDCAPQYKSVVQSFTCHHSDFLRTTPAEHDIISDLLTSPELELTGHTFGNSSVQKPQTDEYHNDSVVEQDVKGMEKSSQTTNPSSIETSSEKEVSVEAEDGLTRTGTPMEQCSTHTSLKQRSPHEPWSDYNVNTEVSISANQEEIQIQEVSRTESELNMDLQVNVHQGNSFKDSSSAYQADQEAADGQADMLTRALSQESANSLSFSVPAKSYSGGNLSDISKHTALLNSKEGSPENASDITEGSNKVATSNKNTCKLGESQESEIVVLSTNIASEKLHECKPQERTELKYADSQTPEASNINKNEEMYNKCELHVSSTNIDNPPSTVDSKTSSTNISNELYRETNDQVMSTVGSNQVASNGSIATNVLNNHKLSTDIFGQSILTDTTHLQEDQVHTTYLGFLPTSPTTLTPVDVSTLNEHPDVDSSVEPTVVHLTNVGATTVQAIMELRSEDAHCSISTVTCNTSSVESSTQSTLLEDPLAMPPQETTPSSNLAEMREAGKLSVSSSNLHVIEKGNDLCTFPKCDSEQVLEKLEPDVPGSQNVTQEGRVINEDGQEAGKPDMEKKEERKIEDERDNLALIQGEHDTHSEKATTGKSLNVASASGNPQTQPTTENTSSPTPDSEVLEKPRQIPSFFTGLKGLKKDIDEQKKEESTPEQRKGPDLMKRMSVRRGLFSEQRSKKEMKGTFLEQLSQLLSFDASKLEIKREHKTATSPPMSPISQEPATEKLTIVETEKEPNVAPSEGNSKSPNAETALEAFKAFFTPKPPKKDTSDLEAMKKTLNKDAIRAIFDRNSSKSPDNSNLSDSKSFESEERTPGRLQAVWPPPKPKDKEEKIGLKYTEAEHQAALLQLKRECKEEVESLEADFKLQLFRLREENAESVSRLQTAIAELKEKAKRSHSDLRDVAVSTEDNVTPRAFRTVCIQTDRETFIKPVEDAELSSGLCPQPVVPKKLDLTSINLSLSGKHPEAKQHLPPSLALPSPPPPPPLPVQSESETNRAPPPPPSLSGHCDSNEFSKVDKSLDRHLPLEKGSGPPPPPPPPPMAGCGLPPPPPPIPGSAPSPPTGVGLLLSKGEEWPQRKPRVEPVCPMKPLYWTRIQVQNNRNDTLWSSLKEPAIINTNEFAELFAKMSSPAKRKPLSEAYEKKGKAKKIIKLLDGKRSQAVGILISSLHLDMKDIQQAVLMLDNSVVDLDAIEALYENRAQPEELERIRKHYETSDEEQVKLLDKPEQFLYELSRIPEFSLRACCIILQSTFTDAIASIKRKTEIVLHVCKDLLEQDSVKEVLGLVLALGNYMNGGSRIRGQADGFGLDILPKLKDVKSRDNHTSLLDYVVSYYLRNLDENAGTETCIFPLPEPQDVFLAAQVKFEDLSKELRKLGKDLAERDADGVYPAGPGCHQACEKDVQSVCSQTAQIYIHPFKEKMEAFITTAQNEQIATEHHLIQAQKSFRDLVEYFGLKPRSGEQDVLPGHVFMLWFEFCNDFKTRWKRENKAISKERLKEAQQSVRNITAEKKVETRRVHANGLKERLRQKEASISST
ncbi:hypothetical protein MHYP_G00058230 [Metynnis hypsauchen]